MTMALPYRQKAIVKNVNLVRIYLRLSSCSDLLINEGDQMYFFKLAFGRRWFLPFQMNLQQTPPLPPSPS